MIQIMFKNEEELQKAFEAAKATLAIEERKWKKS